MKNKPVVIVIAIIFIVVMGILGILALGEKENNQNIAQNTSGGTEKKGNYDVIEAIKHIEVTNTIEEINEILGFEGETSEFSGDCTWKIDSKNWITLKKGVDSPILQATIDKESIKNDNVTLPSQKELQELLNKGMTYEELVEKLGAEGTLESKTSTSIGYIWADKNGQRLGATINNESGKCTVASYR